jgi:hypothetical protein
MLETIRGKKWLGLAIALVALVAFALRCAAKYRERRERE